MKMKRLILFLLALMPFIPSFADDTPIDWNPEDKGKRGGRTIVPHFVASHDATYLQTNNGNFDHGFALTY